MKDCIGFLEGMLKSLKMGGSGKDNKVAWNVWTRKVLRWSQVSGYGGLGFRDFASKVQGYGCGCFWPWFYLVLDLACVFGPEVHTGLFPPSWRS